jgi:hypothetical protein
MESRINKQLIEKMLSDTIDEAFLIEAVTHYCKTVLRSPSRDSSLINKDLWRVIAKRNIEMVEEHYR